MRQTTEFFGSEEIKTSVSGENIIGDSAPLIKFSFVNKEDCTVSVNDSKPIFLEGGIGFNTDQVDVKITSFAIMEDGIPFYWIGGA